MIWVMPGSPEIDCDIRNRPSEVTSYPLPPSLQPLSEHFTFDQFKNKEFPSARFRLRPVAHQRLMCYIESMKGYIHARLSKEDWLVLEELKKSTGQSESQLVRQGLHLVFREVSPLKSALEAAGTSVGKFRKGPHDLASNKKRLEGFGR